MQIEFLNKFSKDIDRIRVKSVKASLVKLIDLLEIAEKLEDIPNLKKLTGHKAAYRVRIAETESVSF